ncbi:signal peptide peptidase SppA [Ancylobacter terrae]|uniref:signal peptide peptidase SppA n=1 Tax=Ancylobacter sp. sgz301288 TaxID=3342077 RepID=UPI00385A6B54
MAFGTSSSEVDQIVDRRRLRRRLAFWRALGIVLLVGGIVALGLWRADVVPSRSAPHVARLTVGGLIRNDRERIELIERIGKSGARALIVSIDSPGGTVAGSEALYGALRRLNERIPVVAVVNGMAASGAYIAAMGTERIFAQRNAMVGSIGVIFQYPNVYELLKTVGVSVEEIKSSPLKAAPNGYEPTSPAARAAIEALVADSYDWFKGLVAERRDLSGAMLDDASNGRVFTGHMALPMHLIDQIGDERDARAWLAKERDVPAGLTIRDWRTDRAGDEFGWLRGAVAGALQGLGLGPLAQMLAGAIGDAATQQRLDGLLALWQARDGG